MADKSFKATIVEELKAAPKDAGALLGGFATAVGFLSFTRHKFDVNLFDLILTVYNGVIADFWKNLLAHTGIRLSHFASSALSWFVILYALHVRGIKRGYYRLNVQLLKNSFNNVCWLALAGLGPLFLYRFATPQTTFIAATMIVSSLLNPFAVALLYAKFKKNVNWFYPFENASSSVTGATLSIVAFFAVVILNSLIFQTLNSDLIPELDGWLEALALLVFTFVFSIFMTAGLYAFIFNFYLAISVPRALFGALIALIAILFSDPLIGIFQTAMTPK